MNALTDYQTEPIAIVGSSCRFPGGASSPSKLWDLLQDPYDLLREIPPSRFNPKGFYHPNGEYHGSTNVMQSYLLEEDPCLFDHRFFNIHPKEAESMDPQQRLLLETVYEGIEAAGYSMQRLKASSTAVFVGQMTADYHDVLLRDVDSTPQYLATGTSRSIMANRVSYFFDWRGPSVTIDTACSSSLVALHQAVQSLRSGESSLAVAAGVNLILGPELYIFESKLHMLSPTGRSRMWDAQADGYARGEGVASVILKPLRQAIADHDRIECIIRETGVNQDGRTPGITMPNAAAQTQLIRSTYERCGLDCTKPEGRCQYFEAHGTGTLAGDPVEAKAIRDVFFPVDTAGASEQEESLYVGSVKTVIGHLEGTAGLAGILKASLALRHGVIPANMHFQRLNPAIEPYYQHLVVPTENQAWPAVPGGGPRRASVNSFGFGGTNAHAILESWEEPDPQLRATPTACGPLTVSAHSERALEVAVSSLAQTLQRQTLEDFSDLLWTLQTRRTEFPYKASFSGSSPDQLVQRLLDTGPGAIRAISVTDQRPVRILGIFTGQGAQWPAMGASLYARSRQFQECIQALDASLACLPDSPDWTLASQLQPTADPSRVHEAAISQPLCTALQIGLVDLLQSSGITFGAVLGHSSGEIAAAYAAGRLTADDAIRIAYYRGVHAHLACGPDGQAGRMMAVGMNLSDAQSFCQNEPLQGRISVAASNSRSSVTLSGDADAIDVAKHLLDDEKQFARVLKVNTAYHSHHMERCATPYLESLRRCNIQVKPGREECHWFSSVHGRDGRSIDDSDNLWGPYWVNNMVQTVLFSQALERAITEEHCFDLVLELGPHPALKGPATETIKTLTGVDLPYTGLLKRGDDDFLIFSDALGFIWKHFLSTRPVVDFAGFRAACVGREAPVPSVSRDLPSYAWDHQQPLWKESWKSREYRTRARPIHELLGTVRTHGDRQEMRWRHVMRLQEMDWLRGHEFQGQVLFPAAGYVSMAYEACMHLAGESSVQLVELMDLRIQRAITLEEDSSGVDVSFVIRRVARSDHSLTAEYTCYSCGVDGSVTEAEKTNFSGRAIITLGSPNPASLPPRCPPQLPLTSLKPARLYASLQDIGLRYSGLFLVDSVRRRLNVATVTMPRQQASPWRVHPATLDAAFHGLFAAFCAPGDSRLWTYYLPTSIERVVIGTPCERVSRHESSGLLVADCHLRSASAKIICGDVDIFCEADDHPEIQVQAITCSSFANVSPQDDRLLFSHTVWQPDISTAVLSVGHTEASPREHALVDLCERASYFYLRQLRQTIAPEEIPAMEWQFRCLMDWTRDHLLPMVESGRHSRVRPEWASDTRADIMAWTRTHPGQIDLEIIVAVGEALPAIVRGKVPILQVMMENDMLNRLYKFGLGFDLANERLRTMVSQISHRYPRLHALEIGAGTGGATVNVLQGLSSQFLSYTYTDISPGFFEKAQSMFHEHRGKMRFKTLDIERDPEPQGFPPHSFDVVIASNVLHATKSLADTMRHCRQLLKPGGYLLLLEITSNTLRPQFVMSGLPGWWLGRADGRPCHPTITEAQWNVLLEESGFSGIDTVCRDFDDPDKYMCSVMSTQAVDHRISALRLPLAYPDTIPRIGHLLVVGGQGTLELTRIVQRLRGILRPFAEHITAVAELNTVSASNVPPDSAVLCLAELDQPTFRDMTEARFQGMQTLFVQAKYLLVGTLVASNRAVLTLSGSNRSRLRVPKADVFPLGGPSPDDGMLQYLMRQLLAEVILEGESSTDGTIWVHGADDYLAPVLEATARTRGIPVFMSTLSPDVAQQTYIHPYSTERDIGRIKPTRIQTLVHLDSKRYPALDVHLRRVAHNDGAKVREIPVYRNNTPLAIPMDWVTLRAFASQFCQSPDLKLDVPAIGFPGPVPVPTLVQDAGEWAGLQVIDWTGPSTLPVPVQPLDARGLFADNKTYFLVGLTGELGLSLCHWMAQHGARYLAIASRNPQVDSMEISSLERAGVQVRVFSLDITDKASLRGVYEDIRATMPPIAGVANAAMVLRDRSFDNMTWTDFEVVLRPKVQGSQNLDELFSDTPLDFFVLFSSLACVIGNRGQANYGAANMFMATLAAQRRNRGLAASILDIGMLLGVGYVARTGEQYETQLKRYRYMSLSEPDFHHMFAEAVRAGHPDSDHPPGLITGLERTNLSREEATAPWHRNPRFAHYTYDDAEESRNGQGGPAGESRAQSSSAQSLRTQLALDVDHDQALGILEAGFSRKLQLILQVSDDSIDRVRPLMDLGIDSLVAVEIRSWFLKELAVDIPVLRVLGGASLSDLCKDVLAKLPDWNQAQAALSPAHALSAGSGTASNSDAIETPAETDSETSRDDEPGASPYERTGELTHAQARLYFPSVFLQDKSTYNVVFAGTLHGALEIDRLKAALHLVSHTHETLRTSFYIAPGKGTATQRVNLKSGIVLKQKHISDTSELDAELKALRGHEFDLEQGQLMKVVVLTSPDSVHRILFGYHHIALDGVSWLLFLQNLHQAYTARNLPSAPQQVIDMAVKQRNERVPARLGSELRYWADRYAGCLLEPVPLFPGARVSSRQILTAYDTETFDIRLDHQLAQVVRTRSSQLQMTSFHFYLAVLAVLVTQTLAVDDFSIGIMDANRVDPLDLQTLGFVLNLLPIRFQPEPHQPFTTLVRQTRDQVLGALANSRVPFDLLLEHLQVPRSAQHSPLFQVALNYRMGDSYHTPLGEGYIEWTRALGSGNPYDLTVDVTETPEDVTLVSFTTHRYLYGPRETRQLMQSYQALLEQLVADPSIPISQPSVTIDPPRAVHQGPPLAVAWPETLAHRIEDIWTTHAESTAIIDGSGGVLTYKQMARRVMQICHAFEELAIPHNSYVAMLMHPGPDVVCTLLAIMRLGHIYVPLDLRNPPERLRAIVSDCQPAVIIVDAAAEQARHLASSNIPVVDVTQFQTAGLGDTSIPNRAVGSQPAFALYTSGSTGQPKGALLTHAGFVNQIAAITSLYDVHREVVLQQSSLGFDMSLEQMFIALANGGTVVTVPQEARGDPAQLAKLMLTHSVTYTEFVPSEYLALLNYAAATLRRCVSWRLAFSGGEKISPQLRRAFRRLELPDLQLINVYGPTEITLSCSRGLVSYSTDGEDETSVGQILPKYTVSILDASLQPVPPGSPGEICIGGIGVAVGYLNKPGETARRFVPDPLDSLMTVYRTGDQGRMAEDGTLHFLGRLDGDSQIKIRGIRIELEDIAQTILAQASTTLLDAAVSVQGTAQALVAFVVFVPDFAPSDRTAYLEELRQRLPLPSYMRPACLVPVDDLPRNPNGKRDRRAIDQLPIPIGWSPTPDSGLTILDETEQQVKRAWEEVLPPSSTAHASLTIGLDTDFFQAGGNSLLLLRLQAVLATTFGTSLGLPELFQASTLRGMAQRLASSSTVTSTSLIDWDRELNSLCDGLPSTVSAYQPTSRDDQLIVILTGATGFLGRHLLQQLVDHPRVHRVHCIAVRKHDTRQSLSVRSPKIIIHPGDLQDRDLGLAATTQRTLANTAHLIIHNGADVSFLKTYTTLRPANVLSVRSLVELALPRTIPIHFISTASIAHFVPHNDLDTPLAETSVSEYPPPADSPDGYAASKWVSESFLERVCQDRGLPVCIHRPTSLVGVGAPATDLMANLVHYSGLLKAVPALDGETVGGALDLVPVGDVAGEIVQMAVELELGSEAVSTVRFVHHCSEVKIPPFRLREYLEEVHGGVVFETRPLEVWIELARAQGLLPLVADYLDSMLGRGQRVMLPVVRRG
ncbi:polyketide synthase [Aspergillus sclerotioniger CBS 115572]|uniref:Polyketide synthase n=1 Tax=Aspergillus sclerotioniger CBS 115572 TaxID=1450535 RepID=A0A317WBS7_9EURO|nr:polyketide synthase [Aspergillus sclerotioniger CBS 115572]PWY83904.1 polyketide synthase [Aspergillus sclerotioniger CBS 115572]